MEKRPWPGASFWQERTTILRGVAVLFEDKADLASMTDTTPPALERSQTGRVYVWILSE